MLIYLKKSMILTNSTHEQDALHSRPSAAGQVFAPAKPALPPSVVVGCSCRAYMDILVIAPALPYYRPSMDIFTACLE
jgi:hypothetical protein